MEFDKAGLESAPLYSEELGIDLSAGDEGEYFRWFLASLLFGGRISETIARHTFDAFMSHGLDTPKRILDAGWDVLVNPVMREGGYVRYDESKSRQILDNCREVVDGWGGKLSKLDDAAKDARDLEARLTAFHGVGPVTANIFLRELRPYWRNANPEPLESVVGIAREIGLDLSRYDRKSVTFSRVEAGLIRMRHQRRHSASE